MERKKLALGGAFCLTAAAALLMICSMNSWLYPVNSWVDVNILNTVGRGMFHGFVPYRDLIDHKGPLIYFLFGLCAELTPGRYHGLYLLEVICLGGAMFFGWKTIRLYLRGIGPAWLAPLFAALLGSRVFASGGSAEEFVLLPMAWSLYDLLRCWRRDEPMRAGTLVKNGVLAGCVLCVKFNLLAFHFVWMAALALNAVWRERGLGRAVKMCMEFLGGMAMACLPWVIYFGVNDALPDLLNGYILKNLFGYGAGGDGPLKSMTIGIHTMLRSGPVYFAALAAAGLAVLLVPRRWMAVREKVTLLGMALLLVAAVYSRVATNVYYGVTFAVFLPFALLPVRMKKKSRAPVWARMTVSAFAVIVSVMYVHAVSPASAYIGTLYEETPQAKLAAVIQEEGAEKPTLMQYRSMDFGFYYAADVWPSDAMFTFMNVNQEECMARIQAQVDGGVPDFVVVAQPEHSEIPELEKYGLAAETVSNYGSERAEDYVRYLLYKRAAE